MNISITLTRPVSQHSQPRRKMHQLAVTARENQHSTVLLASSYLHLIFVVFAAAAAAAATSKTHAVTAYEAGLGKSDVELYLSIWKFTRHTYVHTYYI